MGQNSVETVQTSTPWRPQLPLPKEVTPQQMETVHQFNKADAAKKDTRKWSIGNLFRKKKKDSDSDTSSEEDRKAGFNPPAKRKEKRKRASNLCNTFDHIVVRPSSNEGRKAEQSSATPEGYIIAGANKTGSLDRRLRRQKLQSARLEVPIINSSSGEDGSSQKSSTMSRFKSDESLGNHSGNSNSRRTRAARTERYMKRVNRDDDGHSPVVANQPVGRWHTQPVPQNLMHGSANSINHGLYQPDQRLQQSTGLRNSASLTNMPMNGGFLAYGAPVNNLNQPTNSFYENHPRHFNHTLPYTNFPPTPGTTRDQITSPPPIPPRDASRRLTVQNGNDIRPMSYAFDTSASALSGSNFAVNGKCVSQDQLWNTNFNLTPTQPAQPQQRRFISRHPNTTNIFTTPNTVDDTRSRRANFAKNRQSSHETILYQQKQPYNMGHSGGPLPFTKTSPPLSAFKPTQDFRYVTDITPRSRRPIHILVDNKTEAELLEEAGKVPAPRPAPKPETTTQLLANAVQTGSKPTSSASEFWKKIDQELATNRKSRAGERQSVAKPRSVSSSRALDIANQRNEKLNHELDCLMGRSNYRTRRFANMGVDEVDNVVTAKLCIAQIDNSEEQPAPAPDVVENVSKKLSPTNKYEEHVVKNVSQAAVEPSYRRSPSSKNDADKVAPNTASMPRTQKSPFETLRTAAKPEVVQANGKTPQKGRNLDEAINELEAIYKSLKLSDEEILERATRKDQSEPTFEERRLEFDDEDEENRKEPDVVLDDLSYRNIKHANSTLRVLENQPPFGIPIGPVPPSPGTDYLQVAKPKSDKPRFMPQRTPDLIADDLAVRNLRKDSDQLRSQNDKKRAFRSLSANIQSLLVQKESAKPSGGDFDDFEFLMGRQREGEPEPDVPSNVYALPAVEQQSQKPIAKKTTSCSPAENRGAIYNLPATIKSPPPGDNKSGTASPTSKRNSRLSLPKSVSPDVEKSATRNQMEDILNAIALEAKVTSEKLGKDLIALRKETVSGPKLDDNKVPLVKPSPIKPFGDLVLEKPTKAPSMKMTDEIDEVAKAAKLCEDILKNVVEEKQRARRKSPSPARRLVREIENASQAAKECEKILQDVIDNKPRSSDQVEIANLMKNKEPLEAQKAVHKKLTLDLIAADRERSKEASKSPVVAKPETPKIKEAAKVCEQLVKEVISTSLAPVATPESDEAEIANLIKDKQPHEAQKAVHKKLSLDMKAADRERDKLDEVTKSPVQKMGLRTPVFEAKSPVLRLTLKTETYTFEMPEKKPIEEVVKPKVIAARQKSNSLEHIEEIGPDYDNLRSDFEKNIAKPLKSLQPLPADLPDYDNLQSRSVKSSSPTAEVVKTIYPAPLKDDDEIDQIMREYALKAECQNFNEAICNKIGEKLKHAILNNTSCTDDDKQMNMIELASKTSSSLDLSDSKTTPYSTPKETFSPQLKSPRCQTPAAAINALLTQTSRPSQVSERDTRDTNEPKLRAAPVVAPQIEFIDTADESLYNSAEELAMIFGSKAGTPPRTAAAKATASIISDKTLDELEAKLISATAKPSCQTQLTNNNNNNNSKSKPQTAAPKLLQPKVHKPVNFQSHSDLTSLKPTTTSSCYSNLPTFSAVNFKPVRQRTQEEISLNRKPSIRHTLTPPPRVHSDSSAINALYNIICQENELLDKMSSVTRKPTNGKINEAPKTNGVGGRSQPRSRSTSRAQDQSLPVENGKGVAAPTKEERLAKYKEERRKQQGLAPQQPQQQQQPDSSKSNGNLKRYATRSTTRQLTLDNNVRTTNHQAPKSPTKIPSKVPTSPGKEKPNGVGVKGEYHTSVQARLPKSSSKHLINSSQPATVTVHASTVRTTKASRLRAAASDKTTKEPTAIEMVHTTASHTTTTTAITTVAAQQRKKAPHHHNPALEPASSKSDDHHQPNHCIVRLQRPTTVSAPSKAATSVAVTVPPPPTTTTTTINNNHIANKRLVPSIDVCVNQTLSEFTVEQIRSDISNRNFVAVDTSASATNSSPRKSSFIVVNGNGATANADMASEDFLTSTLTFVQPRRKAAAMATVRLKSQSPVRSPPVRSVRTPSLSPKQSPKHISSPVKPSPKSSPSNFEKDKSSKRKSNLNRAPHEDLVRDEVSQDTSDSSYRRQRRHTDLLNVIVLDDTITDDQVQPLPRDPTPLSTTGRPPRSPVKETRMADNSDYNKNSSKFQSSDLTVRTTESPIKRKETGEKTGSREFVTDLTEQQAKRHDEAVAERRLSKALNEIHDIQQHLRRHSQDNPNAFKPDDPIVIDDDLAAAARVIIIEDSPEQRPDVELPVEKPSFSRIHSSFEKAQLDDNSPPPIKAMRSKKSVSPPVLLRKSIEDFNNFSGVVASNHIVSILKRKEAADSSSASSNTSPVTFSPSVVDTPIRNSAKQGILKKRSSLDESRYSRSHSPDEKSILVKSTRRNSFEEIQHGILKQTSYEIKEEINQTLAHGILKKKDCTTPNEQQKHVSISQAVILAAAELCQDMQASATNAPDDCDIRPILKADPQHHSQPKPILKKKYSSESEEIRPILKSRKSSREEFSDNEEHKRSILKVDSPAKRRSCIDVFVSNIVLERSRSLENPEPRYDTGAAVQSMEKPVVSVAERIRSMEQHLGAVPKVTPTRRDVYKQRFKTQPVTVNEISSLKTNYDLFKPSILELSPLKLKPITSPGDCNQLLLRQQSTEKLSLSPTIESSQSLSTGELNLASLSSDSGIQFNKVSELSCGSGDQSTKVSDSEKSSPKHHTMSSPDDLDKTGRDFSTPTADQNDDGVGDKATVKRTNSVRARASLFQQLESKLKAQEESPVVKTPPRVRRVPQVNLQKKIMASEESEANTQKQSDDSGTEFEPSALPLSERMRFFVEMSKKNVYNSNTIKTTTTNHTNTNHVTNDENALLTTTSAPSSLIETTPQMTPKRKFKGRTVGKLIVPNFLKHDTSVNNNDIENNRNVDEDSGSDSGKLKPKIGRIKSIFFQASTPIVPTGSDNSDFDSGKENDSGSESTKQVFKRIFTSSQGGGAQKNVSANKSLLINTPRAQVADNLAKYFGVGDSDPKPRLRANTMESTSKVSNFSEITQTTANSGRREISRHTVVTRTQSANVTTTTTTKLKDIYRSYTVSRQPVIQTFDDLFVTNEDLKNATADFEKLYVGVVKRNSGSAKKW